MRVFNRIRAWWNRKRRHNTNSDSGILREFVYLDEVSVYSILASRKGWVATEFTENQTASLNSDISATLGPDTISASLHASRFHGSQIVRKAIIQTSFKELYEIESGSLALPLPSTEKGIPNATTLSDLEEQFESLSTDHWIVDPCMISRGDLFEVEVELEADFIFQMMSTITTLRELVENNESIFGQEVSEKLPEMRAMAQVLDSLLVGLVPIKGRLVNYAWTRIGEKEVLIHHTLANQMAPPHELIEYPVYVAGVTQTNLFWKDIRRLLFSRAEYSVFCRLAASGLQKSWNPVKLTGLLEGVFPQFTNLLDEFRQSSEEEFFGLASVPSNIVAQEKQTYKEIIENYTKRVAEHHGHCLDSQDIKSAISDNPIDERMLCTVEGRRAVFGHVTKQIDEKLGVETSKKDAYNIRQNTMRDTGLSNTPNQHRAQHKRADRLTPAKKNDRFLDAEFIAIYW